MQTPGGGVVVVCGGGVVPPGTKHGVTAGWQSALPLTEGGWQEHWPGRIGVEVSVGLMQIGPWGARRTYVPTGWQPPA